MDTKAILGKTLDTAASETPAWSDALAYITNPRATDTSRPVHFLAKTQGFLARILHVTVSPIETPSIQTAVVSLLTR